MTHFYLVLCKSVRQQQIKMYNIKHQPAPFILSQDSKVLPRKKSMLSLAAEAATVETVCRKRKEMRAMKEKNMNRFIVLWGKLAVRLCFDYSIFCYCF